MTTVPNYYYQLEQVVDTMQQNLMAELDLEKLSEIAGFSPFHFHRIFSAIYGETPHDMLTRLRLEKAANLLVKNTNISLTEIAYLCGFSSSSVFSRSFKQRYDISPSVFRRLSIQSIKTAAPILSPLKNRPINTDQWMPFIDRLQIQQKPPYDVVYAVSRGYQSRKINQAWQYLANWYQSQDNIIQDPIWIGVSFDDPLITKVEKCRYYACVAMSSAPKQLPTNLYHGHIPGGLFAVCSVDCSPHQIHEVYMTLYRNWLPQSGFYPADQPPYDVYHSSNNTMDENVEMDICIPIQRNIN